MYRTVSTRSAIVAAARHRSIKEADSIMTKRMTMATAIVTGAGVVAFWGAALAQTGSPLTGPTQADFDQCNQQAALATGASASPRTTSDWTSTQGHGVGGAWGSAAGLGSSSSAGTTTGTPGVGMSANVAGGSGVTSGSPGLGAHGTSTSNAGARLPSGATTGLAASPAGAGGAGGSALSGGSTLSSQAGLSADLHLRGMSATGQSDAAYRLAYRDCMMSRGF